MRSVASAESSEKRNPRAVALSQSVTATLTAKRLRHGARAPRGRFVMSQEEKAIEIATMLGDSVVDVKHCIDPRGGKVSRKTWTLLGIGTACLVASCVAFAVSVSVAAANQRALEYWT